MLACPAVVRLLRGLTFQWAGVNLAIGATTFALLLWLPLAAYVALKQVVSLAITGAGMALTIDRAVRTAPREGFAAERPRTGCLAAELGGHAGGGEPGSSARPFYG